mgnify:CR=1 FL=1
MAGLPGATGQLRALPVPPDNEVDHQAAKIIRSVLCAQGGQFNPIWIVNNWLVLPSHEEAVHSRLKSLAVRRQMKQFVASQRDFTMQWPREETGWIITWADDDSDSDWFEEGEHLELRLPRNGPRWCTVCGSTSHRCDICPLKYRVRRRFCHGGLSREDFATWQRVVSACALPGRRGLRVLLCVSVSTWNQQHSTAVCCRLRNDSSDDDRNQLHSA